MDEGLQTPSARSDVTRGTVIVIPAGTPAGDALVGQTLRLDAGTWALQVSKLVMGPAGKAPAFGPNVLDPTWPIILRVQHGRGVATWWESITCAARGTFLVRANDASQCGLAVGAPGLVEAQEVLLVARQIIAPVAPGHISSVAIADGGGKVVFQVPPGALEAQFIGAAGAGVTLNAVDAAGVNIASTTPGPAVGALIHIPSTAATIEFGGVAPAKAIVATWEVWG